MIALIILVVTAVGPPPLSAEASAALADMHEGDVVEIAGVLYMMHDGKLYTLDDPALDDPALTMTVTGSRVDNSRKKKVVRVDAVDSTEIAETGARTLGDVLEEQAGIQVNGSLGLGQEVQLDGLDGRHVLVLVDGRPVNGRVNNRVDVSRLPVSPSSIERVEIVRGPMSALYGSEALGGVVNIITKDPSATPTAELELGMQWLPTFPGDPIEPWTSFGLHAGGGLGPVTLRFDVTAADLPGFDRGTSSRPACAGDDDVAVVADCVTRVVSDVDFARSRPDGRSDLPDRRNLGMHVEARVPIFDDFSFTASLDGASSQSVAVVSGAVPFADRARNDEWSAAALVEGDVLDDATVAVDLRVSSYHHVFDKLPQGDAAAVPGFCSDGGLPTDPACPAPPDLRTDAVLAESRLELRYTDPLLDVDGGVPFVHELTLSTGAVLSRQRARRVDGDGNDTIDGGSERNTASLYGEVLWRPWAWLSVVPGGRVDAYTPSSQAEAVALGPKIALRAELPAHLAVRASYGRGFRLPSFEERLLRFDHSELGYIVLGEPALRPESSHGFRGELLWDPVERVEMSAEIYLNLIDDLISELLTDSDVDGIPVFTYGNVARAYTSGIHARVSLGPLAGARVDFGYQYLINAVDASRCPDANPYFCSAAEGAFSLPLRAAHATDATARYTIATTGTTLFARLDALSERPVDGGAAPPFVKVSTGLRQELFDHAELVLGLENLLDAYDPTFGPKPGRHATLSVRVWN